jgi:general secretion pathway protein A
MLSHYFGFQQQPFGINPDPQYLYQSDAHREALASLHYGFYSNRGFTALIAPPGMGKTTLLFRFLEDIRNSARTVFLFDTQCEPRELFGYILRDLDIAPGRDAAEMHEQLNEVLVAEALAGRKFVVVIDEAQNLSDAALEMVRLLTNFETPQAKLMQIVLAGQPQLFNTLKKPSLLQLRQRISTFCRLDPLSAEETFALINYRLKRAGYKGEPLFTKDALNLIAEASHGIPRTINNLCFNALSVCAALKRKQVDDNMVAEAIADLQLIPQSKGLVEAAGEVPNDLVSEPKQRTQSERPMRFWVPIAAAILVMGVLSILAYTELRVPQFGATAEDHSSNPEVLPPSAPVPATAESDKTMATESAPNTAQFAITVEPAQTLQNISDRYVGGHDHHRLQQIQTLNPELTDPDYIKVGQTIWLPGPSQVPLATNATTLANARKLP